MSLTPDQALLVGLDDSPLVDVAGTRLLPEVGEALAQLTAAARAAGFAMTVASGYRDFARQLHIWNGKLRGDRPVLDEEDRPIDLTALTTEQQLACVLRFSALPGASRHHWGTDLDVFDAAAVPPDYRLQLSTAEVAPGGPFGRFHAWLDERIAAGESFGFYRPYHRDRGGVACERWHLSYAPRARVCQDALTSALVTRAWDLGVSSDGLACRSELEVRLDALLSRYVQRVDEPPEAALSYRG